MYSQREILKKYIQQTSDFNQNEQFSDFIFYLFTFNKQNDIFTLYTFLIGFFSGVVRNLSPDLFKLSHLTSLYLNSNNLSRIPSDINKLVHLAYLDLSYNKLRSLPSELGDLSHLRELLLNNNVLRVLPYELGKLFNLQNLGRFSNDVHFFYTQH